MSALVSHLEKSEVEADWASRIGAERIAALIATLDLLRQSLD